MGEVLDFGSLTLMDALDLAILVEEEAQERYLEFVEQMESHRTPEAAGFFRRMAGNEAKHGGKLLERRLARFGRAPRRVTRALLWDVEAPDYDQARAFMSARQALDVALQSEIKAHGFFLQALKHVSDPEVHALFEELKAEEVEHQELVRKELAKLPAGPEVNPDDYSDEPTAQ